MYFNVKNRDVIRHIFTELKSSTDWISLFLTSKFVRDVMEDTLVHQCDNDLFITLIKKGCVAKLICKILVYGRVDPSTRENEAIRWASYNGHVEVVKLLLLDSRVDPSVNVNYAILYASCLQGHVEVVRLLLQNERVRLVISDGYVINNGLIELTKDRGHVEVVRLLLNAIELQFKRIWKIL